MGESWGWGTWTILLMLEVGAQKLRCQGGAPKSVVQIMSSSRILTKRKWGAGKNFFCVQRGATKVFCCIRGWEGSSAVAIIFTSPPPSLHALWTVPNTDIFFQQNKMNNLDTQYKTSHNIKILTPLTFSFISYIFCLLPIKLSPFFQWNPVQIW